MDGASILVTGGTGSFGRAFVARALAANPARLVVFSRDEQKQAQMAAEIDHQALRFFIGDVRDPDRLEMAMRGIDLVVHAAALKIVPILEYNPFEAVKTNILGAQNVISAALRTGVKKVVALSTDKASAPLNLYGATKLCSEKLFTAAQAYAGWSDTKFAVCRYGNVSGSRGSVIPLWNMMLDSGKRELPVTHPLCTRFWLTLNDAIDLVYWTLNHMRGGELVVPELPAYQVGDLVQAMGGTPEIIGLRPGEKMHETMISTDEAPGFYSIEDYWIQGPPADAAVGRIYALSSQHARQMDVEELRQRLFAINYGHHVARAKAAAQ